MTKVQNAIRGSTTFTSDCDSELDTVVVEIVNGYSLYRMLITCRNPGNYEGDPGRFGYSLRPVPAGLTAEDILNMD
jgi:hypothetical protein